MVMTTLNCEPYTAQLFTLDGQLRALKLCNGADWGAKGMSSIFHPVKSSACLLELCCKCPANRYKVKLLNWHSRD